MSPAARRAGRAKPLTRERVVDAALALVDRRGLAALTMRSLGRALSVEAMSLYRYFPSKAALGAAIADRVVSEIVFPEGTGPWRDDLAEAGRRFWRVLVAHPNAVPLLLETPLDTAGGRAASERMLQLIGRGGFDPVEAHQIFRITQAYVLGAAMMLEASPSASEIKRQMAALGRVGEWPLLRRALTGARAIDREADFELGLSLLLGALGRRGVRGAR